MFAVVVMNPDVCGGGHGPGCLRGVVALLLGCLRVLALLRGCGGFSYPDVVFFSTRMWCIYTRVSIRVSALLPGLVVFTGNAVFYPDWWFFLTEIWPFYRVCVRVGVLTVPCSMSTVPRLYADTLFY